MRDLADLSFIAASTEADERLRPRLAALVEAARRVAGSQLRAVVLGGSLGRGDGVVLAAAAGPRLLSDIDLFVVVDRDEPALAAAVKDALVDELAGDDFLVAPLDVGVVGADYFGVQGATLPARQIARGHAILFDAGQDWSHPPRANPPAERASRLAVADPGSRPAAGGTIVDPEDALLLLHNRMAEHLLAWGGVSQEQAGPFALYHRWKLHLDAPLAWLAASGMYHPDREAQRQRLQELATTLSPGARSWLTDGLVLHRQILEALHGGAVSLDLLRRLCSAAPDGAREELGVPDSRRALVDWAWPFQRALIERAVFRDRRTAAAVLSDCVEAAPPGDPDVALGFRWLRRRPLLGRMRRARREAHRAPLRITPWWSHGDGGDGLERLYLAGAWRFAGLAQWREPLRGLLVETHGLGNVPADPDRADQWVGRMWSGWVMGGARG